MAGRAFARRSFRGSSRPRATEWLAGSLETTTTALAASTAVLDQTFTFGEKATIVRVRGDLWVSTDQGAASETAFGSLGMSIVKEQASTVGITAVPLPYTDNIDDSFYLLQNWALRTRFFTGAGMEHDVFQHYVLDSKAMRKVDQGDTSVVTMENADATGGCLFLLTFRMLVKLHG